MNNSKPNSVLFIAMAIFLIISIPISIFSWSYVSSFVYYWWMPYIVASYPKLQFSSFVALYIMLTTFTSSQSVINMVKIQKIEKQLEESVNKPSSMEKLQSSLQNIIICNFICPWLILLIAFITFKIVTCFISPIPIG